MNKEEKAKVKALFPEDVEGIYISKNDYDRLYGDLTLENIELKQEIERLNNIIKEVREYIMTNGIHSDYGDKGIDDENKLLAILDKVSDK